MKKWLYFLIMSLIVVPNCCLAVTCTKSDSDGNTYEAEVLLDKDKISLGSEKALIAVNSDFPYEVEYRPNNKEIVSIDENGIVTPLKEGKVNISVNVNFLKDNEVISTCPVNLSLEVLASDATLKSLTLEEIDISPLFKQDQDTYDINLPYKYDKVNIIATPNSETAKVTGDGERYLNEGLNEYKIIVTSSDNTQKTYYLNITREVANEDTTLSSLAVEGYVLSPEFKSDEHNYEITVDKSIDSITIKGTPNYKFATVTGLGTFNLASGKNIFYVTVKSESELNEEKYQIIINKNNGSSKLTKLEIEGYKIEFNPDVFIYNLEVNNKIENIKINAESLENDQIEILNNNDLQVGENEIIIRVTSEDKTSTTYKIIVNRLSKEEEKEIRKNSILLKVLLVIFVISVIIMVTLVGIFIKRNYKRKKINIKKKVSNKKK